MEKTGLLKDEEGNLVMYLVFLYYYYLENITLIRTSYRFLNVLNCLASYRVIK